MNVDDAARIAVVEFEANLDLDDDSVIQCFLSKGVPEVLATRLLQFIPIVFTRFLYRSTPIQFAPIFGLVDEDGNVEGPFSLEFEPVYQAIHNYCDCLLRDGRTESAFEALAARSGGYKALQETINQGGSLEGVVTTPPILAK